MNTTTHNNEFLRRHIGPQESDLSEMFSAVGVDSLDRLINDTVPQSILTSASPENEDPKTEYEILNDLRALAGKNTVLKSYLGQGYYRCIVPAAIRRNVFENPGWYTQYTPYQPEISQGRLEALLNYQTMVADMTGMPVANASLLDEGMQRLRQ